MAALRRADEAPGMATRSLNAVRAFVQLMDDLASVAEGRSDKEIALALGITRRTASKHVAAILANDTPVIMAVTFVFACFR